MKVKLNSNKTLWIAIPLCLVYLGVAGRISAQTTTETEVKSGTVVYVSGNDLVVKLDDGTVKNLVVPDSATAEVDGKTLTVHDLKPGMRLTKTITTTTTAEDVTDVRTIEGRVWLVNPPHVILTLPNRENRQFRVPDGTQFTVNGQPGRTVFDLRRGMNVSATVVTTTPTVTVARDTSVTGTAPVVARTRPPRTPPMVGVILIAERTTPTPAAAPEAAANEPAPAAPEPKPARLPKTASSVPLFGLIGLIALSAGLALKVRRLYL